MSAFKLHSEDSEFNNRVDALFSSLQTAAVDLEPQAKRTWDEGPNEEEDSQEPLDRVGHKFRRPEGLPPQWRGRGRGSRPFGPRNNTPDYVKNPHNWTRYNMKDTPVLSDREEKQVGLKLFDELRSRRIDENGGDRRIEEDSGCPGRRVEEDSGCPDSRVEEENGCPKITFKKPVKSDIKDDDMEEDEKSHTSADNPDSFFGGTKKFKMEEYQVGQPKTKSKPKLVGNLEDEGKRRKGDSVKLNYLMYEDEDGEDDGD